LVQLQDPAQVAELGALLAKAMDDGTSSWHLGADGSWTRHHRDTDGRPLVDLQSWVAEHRNRMRRKARRR
jgi:polyphosphate kinase